MPEQRAEKSRKRVLFVSGRLGIGGAERLVSTMLVSLDRNAFEPQLCLLDDEISYPIVEDVPVTVLNNSPLLTIRTIHRLRQLIEAQKPDIVVSNIALTNRITSAALRGSIHRPKWIARIGNNPEVGGRSGWRNMINLKWDRLAYRTADHFVVNAEGLREPLIRLHKTAAGKTSTLYNPIDFQRISDLSKEHSPVQRIPGRLHLVHAGRFHRQKRHDVLIGACRMLKQRGVKLQVWLCGDGYLRKDVEQQINHHNLADDIKLLGHLENPYAVFKQADIFLLTSDWEGMPNTLLEAMSLGIPAVSTDCDYGPAEVIDHGVNGLLAQCGDSEDIAEKIHSLLTTYPKEDIGEKGAIRVKELFDKDVVLNQWHNFLLSDL